MHGTPYQIDTQVKLINSVVLIMVIKSTTLKSDWLKAIRPRGVNKSYVSRSLVDIAYQFNI